MTTITETFFKQHFQFPVQEQLRSCSWLQLKAANGLDIPYKGYVELDVEVLGKVLPRRGVLVVKDPVGLGACQHKASVPGLLGMNVISSCYDELFRQHGAALFHSPSVQTAGQVWQQVLSAYQIFDHVSASGVLGRVSVSSGSSVCVPAGSLKFVSAACRQGLAPMVSSAFLEPTRPEGQHLPVGLLVSSALLPMGNGNIWVPVVNVGTQDIWLKPKTILGDLHLADVQPTSRPVSFEKREHESGQVAFINAMESTPVLVPGLAEVTWSNLTDTQEQEARCLLEKYHVVFSQGEGDIGCTNLIEHQIPLLDEVPVHQRYRRLPPSQYDVVKAHIQALLEQGVVRNSCSPYSSPIVVVQKKDGTIRLCVDYRQLNAKTRRDAFPLPRIEESLDALSGATLFSTLDLASGYNQVPMAEGDKAKTAFCTPFGLFEFNRMPFGLCNAPGTFQRLMERILGDQSFHSLLLYLDDVVIFSTSFQEHLRRLELVLDRLRQHGLKLKLSKCHFFKSEVKYLGHVISAKGVSTDPDKISAVQEWKTPTTVGQLRSFLGFASYYRRFVEGFAKYAAPLHKLVSKLQPGRKRPLPSRSGGSLQGHWDWSCEQAFKTLKDKLVSAPVLGYADFSKPFVVEVDASGLGLGAVLSQEQGGNAVR